MGIILFEMLTGVTPFADETPEAIFHNILTAGTIFPANNAIRIRSCLPFIPV
ncbi:unnamed protein product [Dibothriocephalus latus]|uniref:Protein kinase domain-containing protein n=1 Tax=Dibothriocephalus latus TaxID=60516 RepID=A0A3P7MII3_DIBLA|nr:unnamed protein product [Dibothriocephalus latus]